MSIVRTHLLLEGEPIPYSQQIYNGLDVCVTLEVFEEITHLHQSEPLFYSFQRALQAPALEMMLRGFKVDELARQKGIAATREKLSRLEAQLNTFAQAIWDKDLNPRSQKQLQAIFYDCMRLPEIWTSKKGERKLSMDREALEKLELYFHARPLISTILAIRDLGKQLDVLETEIHDGRMHTSYNIGGTECVAGDTLIWTKGGLREIEDIYETPYNVRVWNGTDFVIPIKKIKHTQRAGFRLRTEYGYELKCSDNHPVMTQRGWVKAQDLTLTDSMLINNGCPGVFGQHATSHFMTVQQLTEDFCEFYGMILADGSMSNNSEHYSITISNRDGDVKARFFYLATSMFNVTGNVYETDVKISNKHLVQILSEFGFPANSGLGTARWKSIPTEILRGKSNLLRALLRGLTLDSHITDKGIMYGTQSPVMQEQIQQILLVLGIISVKLKTGDGIKLNIPRAYCGRFISMIGFVQLKKLKKITELLNTRCQWHEPINPMSQKFLEIKSIEPWIGDVFDLTMPPGTPPQYIANGFVVHNTSRWSSSKSAFGDGGNLQNVAGDLRHILVADSGYKLVGIDLEQAESREVGWLCGTLFDDWSYLDACYGGDLHSLVCKHAWPDVKWPNPDKSVATKEDRALADQIFYRNYSRRDLAKRLGHGSNYGGLPPTMARHAKITPKMAEAFQSAYFGLFPGIPKYHRWAAQQLQMHSCITNPWGLTRHFFGRANDDTTLREAIAFNPQSSTALRMNLILWRIWRHMPQVQLLGQVHDAVYFQFPENLNENDVISEALSHFSIPMSHKGHNLIVPGEASSGWTWGKFDEKSNPFGLKKFKAGVPDTRVLPSRLHAVQ